MMGFLFFYLFNAQKSVQRTLLLGQIGKLRMGLFLAFEIVNTKSFPKNFGVR